MKRKVCVITSSRADYGLLRRLIQLIADDIDLELLLLVTGMHLSSDFGKTSWEIEEDGFLITHKVEVLMSGDSSVSTAKSMGVGMISFADAFAQLNPDLILVLGDRFEIFSAVSAALVARIPVAHLHGGEVTVGAYDDSFRHSITKMSQLHFVAHDEYRQRVIQLGENPDRVWTVGGLGVDAIKDQLLMSQRELEHDLGFSFDKRNLLVTFHPETLNSGDGEKQMENLLAVLGELKDTQIIFTIPNADTGGRLYAQMIREFSAKNQNVFVTPSLGFKRYISCIAIVDGVVGNSSSGLLEVPSFCKGTINIGDRQLGRLMAKSVINCEPTIESIRSAINKLYSKQFIQLIKNVKNPYGDGGASNRILEIIKWFPLDGLVKKSFFDLDIKSSLMSKNELK